MLRLTTETRLPTMMMMMVTMVMMVEFMVMTAAQSRCDPLTQYEKAGQCCKMCSPGTSMSSIGTCTDPQCQECGENEYQDKYNTESKCQRQPYCNALKNFRPSAEQSKKKRSTCMCQLGFHCSSETCLTCASHATCEAGHGAQFIGNQTHDTVCQECPEGSFSSSNSWDSVCTKWSECESGYHVQERGTDVSDNVCEETSRQHIPMIVMFVVAVCVVGALGVLCCLFRGHAKIRKGCLDSCHGDRQELPQEPRLLLFTPVDQTEKVPVFPELQSTQDDEDRTRTPEENEDELRDDDMSANVVVLTENGKFVTQERGKTEIQPQQESQTHKYTN